ncbi:hypothetical protein BC832DRAFT_549871 [Gaertneriomyces semiglobifer]|nr:hypothetical protein BC832DRAFT_549871 [Gaertneriomyces semiglobifer]
MPGYERIPDTEEGAAGQASVPAYAAPAAPVTTAAAASAAPARAPSGNDGVFSNLSAKPDNSSSGGKVFEEIEPPSYGDLEPREQVPSYYETTILASGIAEDGEVLIDGMPVGDFFTFVVNMLVSMSFDFIGFLLTAMLATSHAARAGSRFGFGITLVRYGLYVGTAADDDLGDIDPNDPTAPLPDPSRSDSENYWVSYFMIVFGFVFIIAAQAEYLRARRLEAVVKASSEIAPA